MGTSYAKIENWPLARYHFLFAEEKGYHSKNLFQNKKIVETQLGVETVERSFSLVDHSIHFALFHSKLPLFSLSLVIILISLISLKKRASLKKLGLSFGFILLPLAINFWISSWPVKLVLKKKALYEGPSELFKSSQSLPQGVFILSTSSDEWEKILYPSQFSGWVRKNDLKMVEL